MTGDPSVPAPQPNPSTGLNLDEIEADFADPAVVGLRKLGTVGTGPLCRLVAAVPALVAEVRRLRGVADAALAELDRSLEARDRRAERERDAARAEADRMQADRDSFARMYARSVERYDDLGMGIMQKIADRCSLTEVLNFVGDQLNECDHADDESIALWKRAAVAAAEGGRVREALQAVRDWAEANHGGAARPVEIWPGLKAALDAGLGDPE